MFPPHRHAEIPLATVFGEPYQLWRFVELEQHRPWFCVTLNIGKGRANWRTMYLVASVADHTKASLIYHRAKNLRAAQLPLGHTKLESTVRYFGIEVDDALEMAEQTEV